MPLDIGPIWDWIDRGTGLASENSMAKWEAGMTTAERRVLISNFVYAANKEVLEKDEARVSCFRRCGILMTLQKSDEDNLIKPQGCTKLPLRIPDVVDLSTEEHKKSSTTHIKYSL